jgi:inositol transport system substrate-binding protein
MQKKLIVLFVLTALLWAMGCGRNSSSSQSASTVVSSNDKSIKIGYSTSSDADVFALMVQNEFKSLLEQNKTNWEVYFQDSRYDVNLQLNQVETFIAQKCDIVIINAADMDGSVSAVEAANNAGIPVLNLINPVSGGIRTYIGGSNSKCGQDIADFIRDKLPKNAKIVLIEGLPGNSNSLDRINGFKENLKRPDVQILAQLSAYWERERGMKIMEDWLQAYPQIDAVVAANDPMALGAIEAMKGANRLKGTIVVGVDGDHDGIHSVADGEMTMTMLYNAKTQARNVYDTIQYISQTGDKTPPDKISGFEPVTKENAADYIRDYLGGK